MDQNYVYDKDWADVMRRYLSGVKGESGLTYQDISEQLHSRFGITQSATNLKSKFSKVNFGAQLFIQLMLVMGRRDIDLNHLLEMYKTQKQS